MPDLFMTEAQLPRTVFRLAALFPRFVGMLLALQGSRPLSEFPSLVAGSSPPPPPNNHHAVHHACPAGSLMDFNRESAHPVSRPHAAVPPAPS